MLLEVENAVQNKKLSKVKMLAEKAMAMGADEDKLTQLVKEAQERDVALITEMKQIVEDGDMEDFIWCLGRSKRLGLDHEISKVQNDLMRKKEAVAAILSEVIQGWDITREDVEFNLREARRLGLEDIVATAEAAILAKEIEIDDGLENSIAKSSSNTFWYWVRKAEKMGMEENIARNVSKFDKMVQLFKNNMSDAASMGTRDEYCAMIAKGHSLSLESDVSVAVNAVRKRFSNILEKSMEMFKNSAGSKPLEADWKLLELEASKLGIGLEFLEHLRKEMSGAASQMTDITHELGMDERVVSASYIKLIDSTNQNNLMTVESKSLIIQNDVRDSRQLCLSSEASWARHSNRVDTEEVQLIRGLQDLPLWPVMQNWQQIELIRKNWQFFMVNMLNQKQVVSQTWGSLHNIKETETSMPKNKAHFSDKGNSQVHVGFCNDMISPCLNSCDDWQYLSNKGTTDVIKGVPIRDKHKGDRSIIIGPSTVGEEDEGNQQERLEMTAWMQVRNDNMSELEAVVFVPFNLTRIFLQQKMNCEEHELKQLTRLDLSCSGLSSFGEGVIFQCCPNLKTITADMNRLTTLRGAFNGCKKTIEWISVQDNFLFDLSGLESLHNLEVLHLESNALTNITAYCPPSEGSLLSHDNVMATNRQPSQSEAHCTLECHTLNCKNPSTLHSGDVKSLLPSNCWPKLKHLSIAGNRLTNIMGLGHSCPNLQVLNLGSNQLSTLGGPQGLALSGMRHLKVLDVGQNRLKGKSLWLALQRCPFVESLVASRNQLCKLPCHFGNVLLRELWLNGNAITRLTFFAWMPNLRRLYLQDNCIDSMEPCWGCPSLEVLDLSFNAITDISQLRQLACFPRLRSLQLNDNPVAEQSDYVDKILEAVPWILELDNEGISESAKEQAIKTLFIKVMNKVGMQYIQEKIARGDIIITDPIHPCDTQEVIITLCIDEKLSPFYTLSDHKFIALAGPSQEPDCFRKELVPLKKLMSGIVDRAILWSALIEASHLGNTSLALRRHLFPYVNYEEIEQRGLLLSSNFEARWSVFAHEKMCLQQKDRLFSANKDERSYREDSDNENSSRPEQVFVQESLASGSAARVASSQLTEETRNMESCFFEHLNFDPRGFLEMQELNSYNSQEFENISRNFIKVQALIRGHLCRCRFLMLKQLQAEENRKFLHEQEKSRETIISKVQAIWRGKNVRRSPSFSPPLHDVQIKNSSVKSIEKFQALWRGYVVRQHLRKAKEFSRYIDDDDFEYTVIDEKEFAIDESTFNEQFEQRIYPAFDGSHHLRMVGSLAKQSVSEVQRSAPCLPNKDALPSTGEFDIINSEKSGSVKSLEDSENDSHKVHSWDPQFICTFHKISLSAICNMLIGLHKLP
ncbi:hypothetical protein O6H91_08G057200 [Diphasiastrum complanatum]|nr:hypothetical protein O6H91_08G057200 [Diphasiastrum complanatum]